MGRPEAKGLCLQPRYMHLLSERGRRESSSVGWAGESREKEETRSAGKVKESAWEGECVEGENKHSHKRKALGRTSGNR